MTGIRRLIAKSMARAAKQQQGFTLIEMIVVVGIIAILAAVVVPNMGKFIGQGTSGAKDAEWESVQVGMHAMMSDVAISAVNAHNLSTTSSATNTWTALPTGAPAVPLVSYLESGTTAYFYCYDATGSLTEQFESGAACTQ